MSARSWFTLLLIAVTLLAGYVPAQHVASYDLVLVLSYG
jgi:hypothetical protein